MMVLQEVLQGVDVVNGDAPDLRSHHSGRDVEGGVHGEAGLGEHEVLQQRVSQIAYTDHDQMVVVVHAQNMSDLRPQLLHIIAIALLSELPEAAEILTDLRGCDIHLLPQRVGGDADHAAVTEVRQLPVISGQPPDNGI